MKQLYSTLAVFMALLLSTLAVCGAAGVITESSPEWGKAHPGFKKYEKYVQEEKWQKAADILRKFDTSRDADNYFKTYADVFRHVDDTAAGLAQLEQRLYILAQNPERLKQLDTTLLSQMFSAAYYAHSGGWRSNLRSKLTMVNACILHESDDPAGAFAMAERIPKGELGYDQKIEFQRSMALPGWKLANKNADWPAAAVMAAFIKDHGIEPYRSELEAIGLSCEKAGDFPLAQYFYEKSIGNSVYERENLQHVKTVAAFVKQHGLQSDHWLVKSILLHDSGQTLAALELLGAQAGDSSFGYLKELLPPAFAQAYAKSDWATAAHLAGYTVKVTPPPDGEYLLHILEAMEKAVSLNSPWSFASTVSGCGIIAPRNPTPAIRKAIPSW